MMRSNFKNASGILALLAIILLTGFSLYLHSNLNRAEDEKNYYRSKQATTETELEEAHNKLDEANSNIEEAKNSAWESYEDMGDALDKLDTVQQ